jgi:hypothetical protein
MKLLRRFIATFVAAGLAALLVASTAHPQPAVNNPGLARAIEVQERHTNKLVGIQRVVGTAVGLGSGGQPVIKIYTEERGVPGLPRSLEGVPVVVQVTGKIVALHHRPGHGGGPGGGDEAPAGEPVDGTSRFPRPVPIGVSTGHPDITAGTIGARVTDGVNVYALSNNHVYADENQAAIGDNVLQPGPFDGGLNPGDAIGTLADFEPIVFSTLAGNVIDAAIASTTEDLLDNSTPQDGYGTPASTTAAASINQRVQKYGRTTGLTSGKVDAINATVNIGYSTGVARFVRQIVIRPGNFSAGGDSGSIVVVRGGPNNRKPVGLLFAGSLVVSIANPIDEVLDTFGVTVDGQ